MKLLLINPGSTSTKFGVWENGQPVFTETIRHESVFDDLPDLISQRPFREALILEALAGRGINPASMDAVVGRGGLLHPLNGGVYEVNQDMIDDLSACRYGRHASNLGGIIAWGIAQKAGLKAYIADPVIVDELEEPARFSGYPGISRQSIFHALNQKAVARRYAREAGKSYTQLNLIVAHLGGGISIGAHSGGRVIDVNNALGGDGPFSPERAGGLPVFQILEICSSGHYSLEELKKRLVGQGGLYAYLGTADAVEVDRRIADGDQEAEAVLGAMAYQIAKEVGAAAAVLSGQVDAVIITGGLAYDTWLVDRLTARVRFIAPVVVYPGEDELAALAQTVGDGLAGLLPIHQYRKE